MVAYSPDTVREMSKVEWVYFLFLRVAIVQSIDWTLDDRGNVVRFLKGTRTFYLFQNVYTAIGSTQLTV